MIANQIGRFTFVKKKKKKIERFTNFKKLIVTLKFQESDYGP